MDDIDKYKRHQEMPDRASGDIEENYPSGDPNRDLSEIKPRKTLESDQDNPPIEDKPDNDKIPLV